MVRVKLVVDSKNLPPSYGEQARRVAMNLKHQSLLVGLALVFVALIGFTLFIPSVRSDDEHAAKVKEASEQSAKAGRVFDEIMRVPDKAIPRDLLAHAKAIAVFPDVIKAAFVFGGEGGRGVVSRRTTAGWSDPVFFRAGGGSVGPQIGASSTDFVLVIMNDDALRGLMKDKFELGTEASVAVGPVGREAGAGTDALMHAEILSYSRSRGLFTGINLKGVIIRPEDDLNRAVYGGSAHELLANGGTGAAAPPTLPTFPETIARYAPASGSNH